MRPSDLARQQVKRNERECLDHVIIFREAGPRCILHAYVDYYERSRTHLALDKDTPIPRDVQPRELGRVVAIPQVGGLTIATNAAPPDQTCRSSGPSGHACQVQPTSCVPDAPMGTRLPSQ